MSAVGYDDSSWRKLDVPHDWAAEGDFSSSNKSGAGGGALPGGIAGIESILRFPRKRQENAFI